MTGSTITPSTLKYVLKDRARYGFSAYAPRLFCWAERIKNGSQSRSVRHNTDLVIEGYPRSGNSFAFHTIQGRVGPQWRIAHHLHLPVQIELGVRWGRPVLVLVRAPEDATVSFVGLQLQSGRRQGKFDNLTDTELALRLREATRYYIHFYEHVLAIKREYLIVAFHDVTRNLGGVLTMLNKRFGLNIPDHPVSVEERDLIFGSFGHHLAPNAERDEYKHRIEGLRTSAVPEQLHERARAVFDACLEIAGESLPGWREKHA